MDFLNPALLWGLFGVSVPILIHLLNRFRYREVRWAAMDLLQKALVVRSRRVRIEDLLLLALRCLAVLLVALALTRPTVTSSGARWLGSGSEAGAVLAIDASFSMAYRSGLRSRFEKAIERAREALGTLPPGAPVSLVSLGDRPRILLRNVGLDPGRIEKTLEGLRPFPEGLDVEAALEELDGLVAEIRSSGRECYVVTDAQAASLREISPRAREALSSIAGKARAYFLTVGSDGDENLAIESLERVSGLPREDATGRFRVSVRNAGSRAREGASVTLTVDGSPVDSRTIDRIEPGASAEAALFGRFEREGSVPVTARIDGDPLPADDTRYLVVEVRSRTRVLCVGGEPGPGAVGLPTFEGETGYLTAALTAGRIGREPPAEVEACSMAELPAQSLSGFDVTILANVPEVPSATAGAILNFVRAGGGLIVFLGDAIAPALTNESYRSGGAGLLPAQILEAVDAAAQGDVAGEGSPHGRSIDPGTGEHPMALAVRALKPEILDEARIARWFRVRLAEGARPILRISGSGDVLLAERDLGRGKVLLFTTSAGASWNDLAMNPAYPILIQEALAHLTRRANERPLVVGNPISVALPGEVEGEEVTFRDPAGTPFPVRLEPIDGLRIARLPAAGLPGFYAIDVPGGQVLAAANVDARESDVRTLEVAELARAIEGPGVRVVGEGEDLAAAVREGRTGKELWRGLIFACVGVLVLESFLARRFSRRMASGGGR